MTMEERTVPPPQSELHAAYSTRPGGMPLQVVQDGHCLVVQHSDGQAVSRWQARQAEGRWQLPSQPGDPAADIHPLRAAVEAVFAQHPDARSLWLDVDLESTWRLCEAGVAEQDGSKFLVPRDAFWQ